jgi:hypothetical protein
VILNFYDYVSVKNLGIDLNFGNGYGDDGDDDGVC